LIREDLVKAKEYLSKRLSVFRRLDHSTSEVVVQSAMLLILVTDQLLVKSEESSAFVVVQVSPYQPCSACAAFDPL
jgi:hypothetical protein